MFTFIRRIRHVCLVENVQWNRIAHRNLAAKKYAKRTTAAQMKTSQIYLDQKQLVVDYIRKGTLDNLDTLKSDVFGRNTFFQAFNPVTFDAHFIHICSEVGAFKMGRDYFLRLYETGKAGTAAIGKYFIMCHQHRSECSTDDHKLMSKLYDQLLEKYGILDVVTCEAIAQGLVLTDRWRSEIPRLLEMVRQSGNTPSPTLWTAAVESALFHGDERLAWEYMDSAAMSGKPLMPVMVEVVLRYPLSLRPFLKWLDKHGVILCNMSADEVVKLAPIHQAKANISRVPRNGVCQNCRQKLIPTPLQPEEFTQLQDAFLEPVLIGKNVFLKTTEEEINTFKRFLNKCLPVDVVLDGLNISYLKNKLSPRSSELLKHVTSHFAAQSKKILVIGRKHMEKWPPSDMKYIRSHANIFLADDLSQDDPFLLYAALKSGPGTRFVSRDRMGSHKFLLGTPELRRVFSKWQALNQYHPLHVSMDGSKVALRPPLDFARQPQETQTGLWHLPVNDYRQSNIEGHLQDETAPWICMSLCSN